MPAATLLLPARARFAGEALPADVARALGRADSSTGLPGPQAVFDVLPRGWPAAAATRQRDRGDAAGSAWLRVDPAYVRPDINGARLMAIGDGLQLDAADAESLLQPLRPLFGDSGMPIDATLPARWYLRIDPGAPLPVFADPDQALGADLFDHLPPGDAGRRWRALLSEAQVTLHQHPVNAERASRGLVPINSVWFWGAGRLPDHVACLTDAVSTDDEVVAAFATLAQVPVTPVPSHWPGPHQAHPAFDLRHARRLDLLCSRWLSPAVADMRRGRVELTFAFDDGHRLLVRRSQALRFWRRPLRVLSPADAE